MRMRTFFILGLLLAPVAAPAQQIVSSPKADTINVTIYRDPHRGEGAMNRNWLNGFALVTETRTITLPVGESQIKFEGVADGMIAVSAVVTGLPGGVVQKNRDAALLSPASLLDGTLGNRVTIRRTNKVSGKIEEQDAIIRSGPQGAVILQTDKGYESLRCSGLPETLVYDGVPQGLTAKPTLSVVTRSEQAVTAKVTLTYLATGFDWGANYVATVNPDGKALDLFAWLTVANSNDVSFPDANMMAVAGTLNKVSNYNQLITRQPPPALNLQCYPLGSGRDGIQRQHAMDAAYASAEYAPELVPAPPPAPVAQPLMVTASRVRQVAQQEDLGDLKLYRVPMQVTVAANQQKQVALLIKDKVPFDRVYEGVIRAGENRATQGIPLTLRMKNESKSGLGVPLPSGGVALFEDVAGQKLLAGRTNLRDHAINEEVEFRLKASPLIRMGQVQDEKGRVTLTVTNANAFAVQTEIGIAADADGDIRLPSTRLKRKDGLLSWFATVPANGSAILRYKVKVKRPKKKNG